MFDVGLRLPDGDSWQGLGIGDYGCACGAVNLEHFNPINPINLFNLINLTNLINLINLINLFNPINPF